MLMLGLQELLYINYFPEDSTISEVAQELINGKLNINPEKRSDISKITPHGIFKQMKAIPNALPNTFIHQKPSLDFINNYYQKAICT